MNLKTHFHLKSNERNMILFCIRKMNSLCPTVMHLIWNDSLFFLQNIVTAYFFHGSKEVNDSCLSMPVCVYGSGTCHQCVCWVTCCWYVLMCSCTCDKCLLIITHKSHSSVCFSEWKNKAVDMHSHVSTLRVSTEDLLFLHEWLFYFFIAAMDVCSVWCHHHHQLI